MSAQQQPQCPDAPEPRAKNIYYAQLLAAITKSKELKPEYLTARATCYFMPIMAESGHIKFALLNFKSPEYDNNYCLIRNTAEMGPIVYAALNDALFDIHNFPHPGDDSLPPKMRDFIISELNIYDSFDGLELAERYDEDFADIENLIRNNLTIYKSGSRTKSARA
jgi:hypothetical protein